MAAKRRKSIDDMVVQRMVRLLRKQGKEEKELMDYIGLQPGSMKNWKYAGSYGYMKYMKEICEFLDTTPNYLFYGPDDPERRVTPMEREMIQMYREIDEGGKKRITDLMKDWNKRQNSLSTGSEEHNGRDY